MKGRQRRGVHVLVKKLEARGRSGEQGAGRRERGRRGRTEGEEGAGRREEGGHTIKVPLGCCFR
jgi:hypothetical protein